jgi:hypothetical protein
MFDTMQPDTQQPDANPDLASATPDPGSDPGPVPLERLEAQICELAGHIAAATCRFLVLLGDFDARRGWESWDMPSCAGWLSWKCQMSSGAAREHVRVARALRDLPVIRAEFGAARLSYAKVRALTRIATPATEQGLAEMARPMTGNQLERFARAHREVSRAGDAAARTWRRLSWRFDDDGSLSGTFRLPPLAGAVLLQALRAAAGDLEHPHGAEAGTGGNAPAQADSAQADPQASAGTPAQAGAGEPPAAPRAAPVTVTSCAAADALLVIAEAFLAGQIAAASNPEVYQVIVHVGTGVLAGVSAETPPPGQEPDHSPPGQEPDHSPPGQEPDHSPAGRVPGHPADPARCHVEDGPAVSVATAQMLTCTAVLSWMRHDHDGTLLDAGRRRRKPGAALRRAARERDHCRCRYPGCESRRVDLHHIQHWINGGRTCLENLLSLCRYHHMLVHDRGYLIAARPGGDVTFCRPDGTAISPSPPLPPSDGTIADCHDADITPGTIIPPWYGEHLDLDYAIHAAFANAGYQARQPERDQRMQAYQQAHPEYTPRASYLDEPEPEPRDYSGSVNIITAMREAGERHASS